MRRPAAQARRLLEIGARGSPHETTDSFVVRVWYRGGAGARRLPSARACGRAGDAARRAGTPPAVEAPEARGSPQAVALRRRPLAPLDAALHRAGARRRRRRHRQGAMCLHVASAGKNPWDVQLRHREMTIQKGHTYTIAFKAWASAPTQMRAKVGMSGAPYREYYAYDGIDLGPTPIKRRADVHRRRRRTTRRRRWRSTWAATWPAPSRSPSASTTCTSSIRRYVAAAAASGAAGAARAGEPGGPVRERTEARHLADRGHVAGAVRAGRRGRACRLPRPHPAGAARPVERRRRAACSTSPAYRGTGRHLRLRVAAPGGDRRERSLRRRGARGAGAARARGAPLLLSEPQRRRARAAVHRRGRLGARGRASDRRRGAVRRRRRLRLHAGRQRRLVRRGRLRQVRGERRPLASGCC